MLFVDTVSDRVFTLGKTFKLWQEIRRDNPRACCDTFRAEYLAILTATARKENDLRIIGATPGELARIIEKLTNAEREEQRK